MRTWNQLHEEELDEWRKWRDIPCSETKPCSPFRTSGGQYFQASPPRPPLAPRNHSVEVIVGIVDLTIEFTFIRKKRGGFGNVAELSSRTPV